MVDAKDIIGDVTNKIPAAALDIVNDVSSGGIDKLLSAEQGKLINDRVIPLESGILGSIPFDTAPTDAISGVYVFSSAGNVTWFTIGGSVPIKIGDKVTVKYTAPSTFIYTHIPNYNELSDSLTSDLSTVAASSKSVKTLNDTKVSKTGNESIDGIKTFNTSPILPTPTTDMQGSTKKYVDDIDIKNESYNVTTRVPLAIGQYYTSTTARTAIPTSYKN